MLTYLNYSLLAIVLATIVSQKGANGDLYSGLTPTQLNGYIYQFSGALSIVPNTKKIKVLNDLSILINQKITAANVILSNALSNNTSILTESQNAFADLKNQLNQINDFAGYFGLVTSLFQSSSKFSILFSKLPSSVQTSLGQLLNQDEFIKFAYNSFDLSTYIPNTNNLNSFWNQFPAKYSNDQFYNTSILTPYGKYFTLDSFLIEVSSSTSLQSNIFETLYGIIHNRPAIIDDIYQRSLPLNSLTWSTSQLKELSPIIRQLSCFHLKKIDYNNLYTTWLSGSTIPFPVENFERILQCNAKFIVDAINSTSSANLNDNLKTLLANYYTNYILTAGVNDPVLVISLLGNNIQFVSGPVLQKIVNLMTNSSILRDIYVKYQLKTVFQTLKSDFKSAVAGLATRYFNDLGSKTFDSIDADMFVTFVFSMKISDAIGLLSKNKNYQLILPYTDQTPVSYWQSNCDLAMTYYYFLVKMFGVYADPQITINRLKPMLICKQNCDFPELIDGKTNLQIVDLAKQIIPALNSKIQPTCISLLGSYIKQILPDLASISLAQIKAYIDANVSLSSIFTPNEISKLSTTVLQQIYPSLSKLQLDPEAAKKLAAKLQALYPNLAISDLNNLISGKSLDYLMSRPSSDIINNIDIIIDNSQYLDDPSLIYCIKTYLAANPKVNLLYLISHSNTRIVSFLTVKQITDAGITIADIAGSQKIPDSILRYLYDLQFKSKDLNSLSSTDLIALAQLSNGITATQCSSLSINALITISQNSVTLSSSVRKCLLTVLKNYLTSISTSSASIWETLTSSLVSSLSPELFFELKPEELVELAKLPAFQLLAQKIGSITANQVCSYNRVTLKNFIGSGLIVLSITKDNLTDNGLDYLGPLVAINLPTQLLTAIPDQVFKNHINVFKSIGFQLSSSDSKQFGKFLNNLLVNKVVKLSDLGELTVFLYPEFAQSVNSIELKAQGLAILDRIKAAKSLANVDVKNCRMGLTYVDDNDITARVNALITAYGNTFVTQKKRRGVRSVIDLSCANINNFGDAVTSVLTVSNIASISDAEFQDCLSFLGSKTNWNADQLAVLAQRVKTLYGNVVQNIPSSIIRDMGQINLAFSASDLSNFNIISYDAVIALGKITQWSSDQINALLPLIKNKYGLTSDSLNSMFNLVCGLSAADINSISTSTILGSISTLSGITAKSCSNLNLLFNLIKSAYGANIWTTGTLTEIQALAGGISSTDFTTYISQDLLSVLSPNAFKLFSASTLNNLTNDQIGSLQVEQINAIVSSPNFSQLNSQIQESLIKAYGSDPRVISQSIISTSSASISCKSFGLLSIALLYTLIKIF